MIAAIIIGWIGLALVVSWVFGSAAKLGGPT